METLYLNFILYCWCFMRSPLEHRNYLSKTISSLKCSLLPSNWIAVWKQSCTSGKQSTICFCCITNCLVYNCIIKQVACHVIVFKIKISSSRCVTRYPNWHILYNKSKKCCHNFNWNLFCTANGRSPSDNQRTFCLVTGTPINWYLYS